MPDTTTKTAAAAAAAKPDAPIGQQAVGSLSGGMASAKAGAVTAPTLTPDHSSSVGVTAWNNSKHVTQLWSINQNRNAWIAISGIGWKKLANNSDTAIVAMTVLAASAKQL